MTVTANPPASPIASRPSGSREPLLARWRSFGRPPRLMGIDVARGVAVFGMIAVHFALLPALLWNDPSTWGGLAFGRSSILFALVAGISLSLASGATRRPGGDDLASARLRTVGRGITVLLIGLGLELLGSEQPVILTVYGVLFLLVVPFLGMPRWALWAISGGLVILGPWAFALLHALAIGSSGPGALYLVFGPYPLTTFFPVILAGMAIGRLRLGTSRTAATLLAAGFTVAVVVYGVGSAVNATIGGLTEVTLNWAAPIAPPADFFPTDVNDATGAAGPYIDRLERWGGLGQVPQAALGVAPHSGGTFEIIGSGGLGVAIVGACLLAVRVARTILLPVAAVGTMALTAYSAHIIAFALTIDPYGLVPELAARVDVGAGQSFWGWFVVVLLIGCTVWTLTVGQGPLERVLSWAARRLDVIGSRASAGTHGSGQR